MKKLFLTVIVICLLSCMISTAFTMADNSKSSIPPPTEASETAEFATEPPKNEPKPIYLNVSLSNSKQAAVRQICEKYGVPFDLVIAIMSVESNFDEKAVSDTDDYGVMQINKINHEWLKEELGVTDILDFEQNVESGCYILSGFLKKYTDVTAALMCYNCGERRAKELWAAGIHTTEYTRKVLKARELLTWQE